MVYLVFVDQRHDCYSNNKINDKSTLLVSVYLDINWIKVIPDSLHKVMISAEDKQLGVFLAADTNCHSSLFGPDNNKRT